jgi:hypothetical protein
MQSEADVDFRKEKLQLSAEEMKEAAEKIFSQFTVHSS